MDVTQLFVSQFFSQQHRKLWKKTKSVTICCSRIFFKTLEATQLLVLFHNLLLNNKEHCETKQDLCYNSLLKNISPNLLGFVSQLSSQQQRTLWNKAKTCHDSLFKNVSPNHGFKTTLRFVSQLSSQQEHCETKPKSVTIHY